MKTVGFINSQDLIKGSHPFEYYLKHKQMPWFLKWRVKRYLKRGTNFFGFLSYLYDDEKNGKGIGNHDFFTDGVYVWPSYLVYYLREYPQFSLDADFIAHIRANKFRIKKSLVSQSVCDKFMYELVELFKIAIETHNNNTS